MKVCVKQKGEDSDWPLGHETIDVVCMFVDLCMWRLS